MQLSEEQLLQIKNYFSDKRVLKAYLFGSYSRGEADFDSDIDILVGLDYTKHIGLAFVEMHLDLQEKLKKKVDLISSEGVSRHIFPFIEKDKVLIYEG